ncbi:MAG: hypothetical protein HYX45_00130 [Burkholderiales bacterium]|nr:hypothetical protein [Burkholderiales bacterium]
MRYIIGMALVVSLLQGNIPLALTIAACVLVAIWVYKLIEKFQRDSSFSTYSKRLNRELGEDWVTIRLQDADHHDPAALVFNPKNRTAYLISSDGYGSKIFRSRPVGEVVSVRIEKLQPAEIIQPNALINIECKEISRRFTVSGESNWQLLRQHFPGVEQT